MEKTLKLLAGQKYRINENDKEYYYVTPGGFLLSSKSGKHKQIESPYEIVGFDCEAIAQYVFEEIDWQQAVTNEINEYVWEIDRSDMIHEIESALVDILDW